MHSVTLYKRTAVLFFSVFLLLLTSTPASAISGSTSGSITAPPGSIAASPQEQAERCSTISQNRMICIKRQNLPDGDAMASASAVVPFPTDICLNKKEGSIVYAETSVCSVTHEGADLWYTENGKKIKKIGTNNFTVMMYQYSSMDSKTLANQISIRSTSYTGVGNEFYIYASSPKCTGSCKAVSNTGMSSLKNKVLSKGKSLTAESYYSWTGSGPRTNQSMTWNYVLKHPTASNTVPYSTSMNGVSFGCDSVSKSASARPGCRITKYPPRLTYSSAANKSFASHIKSAQASGLPGDVTPLHRLDSNQTAKNNNAVACPVLLKRPSQFSCDEYPFASTKEGAFYGGGNARTFDFCKINHPAWVLNGTGRMGFSSCMIPAKENSSAGGQLSQFYARNHILNGDAFTVSVR